MLRRTVLKSLAAAFAARPAAALAQQAAAATTFSPAEIDTLHAIADVVLPAEIGAEARKKAVTDFVSWFANYRQGADMGHGYGASTLRAGSGSSPFSRYPAQFAALDAAARSRGGQTFQALPVSDRRAIVEQVLNDPQPVNRMPAQPTGANLVADLMGSYFSSADAWDACYRAEIQRDSCRTLDNSAEPPRPLKIIPGALPPDPLLVRSRDSPSLEPSPANHGSRRQARGLTARSPVA
jgi:hypothetical protein